MKNELIVFVRIALFIIAGRGVAGGWLPAGAEAYLTDPAAVETMVSVIVMVATGAWYLLSAARRALKAHV